MDKYEDCWVVKVVELVSVHLVSLEGGWWLPYIVLSLDPILLPDAHPGQVVVGQGHLQVCVNHKVIVRVLSNRIPHGRSSRRCGVSSFGKIGPHLKQVTAHLGFSWCKANIVKNCLVPIWPPKVVELIRMANAILGIVASDGFRVAVGALKVELVLEDCVSLGNSS